MNLSGHSIYLASTSRYRRSLIERLGLGVQLIEPPLDEELEKSRVGALEPSVLAEHLARAKAESVRGLAPGALVIGGDQIAVVNGEILHKPQTEARAVEQLLKLSGREHRLYTAVAVHDPATGRTESATDIHRLHVRSLSGESAADYVHRDQPLDCAGSYRIESLGIALFERIEGNDPTAIIGMPLTLLTELLSRFNVTVLG